MSYTDDREDRTYLDDVNKNNFQQVKNKAIKIGYAEGVNDGRETVFQKGFDQGYRDGLAKSFSLEKYRAFFDHLNINKINNIVLVKEKEEYEQVSTANSKSILLKDHSLNLVSQNYIEESIKIYAEKMPIATNLLNA